MAIKADNIVISCKHSPLRISYNVRHKGYPELSKLEPNQAVHKPAQYMRFEYKLKPPVKIGPLSLDSLFDGDFKLVCNRFNLHSFVV